MRIDIQFPHDSQLAEKLGEFHWTESFTPEEFIELDYREEGPVAYITYEDVSFEVEKIEQTEEKMVLRAERVWY